MLSKDRWFKIVYAGIAGKQTGGERNERRQASHKRAEQGGCKRKPAERGRFAALYHTRQTLVYRPKRRRRQNNKRSAAARGDPQARRIGAGGGRGAASRNAAQAKWKEGAPTDRVACCED